MLQVLSISIQLLIYYDKYIYDNALGNCTYGPETQCYDAFSTDTTDTDVNNGDSNSCNDYTKNDDVVLFIVFSTISGVVFGIFAAVILMYLFVKRGTTTSQDLKETLSPLR